MCHEKYLLISLQEQCGNISFRSIQVFHGAGLVVRGFPCHLAGRPLQASCPGLHSKETSPRPLGSARFPAPLDWHGQPLQPKEFPEGPSFVSAPQHRFVFGRAVGIVAEDAGEVVGGIDLQPRQQDQTIVTSRIARSMERPQPVSARWVGCGPGLLAAWCPCRSARGFPGTGTLRNVGFPPSTQTFSASGHQPAGD